MGSPRLLWSTSASALDRASPVSEPCQKGTNLSIARTTTEVISYSHARTGGHRKMSGRLFGYVRVSVANDADANNLENQRRVLAGCAQVFEDVGSGASWNRPGLNRLKAALQPGDCVMVTALDRFGRSLTEVLELLGWLRVNGGGMLGHWGVEGQHKCPVKCPAKITVSCCHCIRA